MQRIYKLLIILAMACQPDYTFADAILTGRSITSRNGLSSNQVFDIVQDSLGFVWMGTASGLCRFDGYSFYNYPVVGVGEDKVNGQAGTLFIDRTNQLLWIRTLTFHYACYDLRQQRFVNFYGDCLSKNTYQRYAAKDGCVWMYEEKTGIRRITYKGGTFSCRDYDKQSSLLKDRRIKRIFIDNHGNAWASTDKGLLRFDRKGHPQIVVKEGDFLASQVYGDRCFFLTRDNHILIFRQDGKRLNDISVPATFLSGRDANASIIWQDKWIVMTRDAVLAMNCKDYTLEKPSDYQMEYGILLDKADDNYWISDKDNTLWLFPRAGKPKSFRLLHDTGNPVNRKRHFSTTVGSDGRFYIASYGNGLFVYDPAKNVMEHYKADNGQMPLTSNYLTDIYADKNGCIWISQDEAGVVCLYSEERCKTDCIYPEPTRLGEQANFIQRMGREQNGRLTVSTRVHRDYHFTPKTGTFSLIRHTSSGNEQTDSIVDGRGRTWIATWEQGLLCRYGGSQHYKQFLNSQTTESRINALAIDKKGRLWIATYNGLYSLDTNQQDVTEESFSHFSTDDGLPSNNLVCLLESKDGSLWTGGSGTGAVRCRFDHRGKMTIDTISARQGLPNDNVHSLAEDHLGCIWVGCEEALACIDPSLMKAEQESTGASLLSSLFTDNCARTLSDGRIAFGTHNGLLIITPAHQKKDNKTPEKAYVTNIHVNGSPIYNSDEHHHVAAEGNYLALPYHENSLTIDFSNFDYRNLQHAMYQYYLEGVDQEWRKMTTQHSADYSNLPPGKYIFHLRTSENSEETLLRIIIHQPWYNTWWAWLLYLIVIGSAIGTFVRHKQERYSFQQQMKLEQQLSEFRIGFFTQVAHEFRTPLAIINGAVNKMTESGQASRKPLQTAQRGIKRLTQLVNQLMEFRKLNTGNLRLAVEQGDIVSFIQDVYQDFRTTAQQKEQNMTFSAFERKYETVFDRHVVDTIVYNLLSNAVKYTPQQGQVEIRLKKEDNQLLLIVEDSGVGIDDERQQQLFKPFMHGYASQGGMGIGLYTAHKMALAHKGSLTYSRSERLGGAKFTLAIPADDSLYATDEYRSLTAIKKNADDQEQSGQVILEMLPKALNDCRVVIIEDDPDMLEQIKTEIGVYFLVEGYTSGKAGYEAVMKEKPALLICDIMLPDMNGYQIVKQIKVEPSLKELPIIMLTALDDERHQIKGYEAGADDYMVKPCNYRILTARAVQLIKWSQSPTTQEDTQETTTAAGLPQPEQAIITSQADKRFLERVNTIVAQHISDPDFTIDQMAEMMRMGRTKLYGKVKELTGMSPNKLFVSERMRIAAKLIEEDELNISEIGYRVGIQDAAYFNKCFKQYFGMAPSKYRKK